MEPGGIEPPCRVGQLGASTRVVICLISALGRQTTASINALHPAVSHPFTWVYHAWTSPIIFALPPHRASGDRRVNLLRLPLRTACWQL